VSHDASGAAAAASGAVIAEELAAVRAALAKQQEREVPEDERWAVQVRCGWVLVVGYWMLCAGEHWMWWAVVAAGAGRAKHSCARCQL